MTYPEAIRYLESLINYEKITRWPYKGSLKLERIKNFLKIIGDPQDSLACIHVAGTKGKGSTCAFIAYILRQAGYDVGLYTSPHLSDFRERIRILSSRPGAARSRSRQEFEGMISQKSLAILTQRLKPAIEKYNRRSKYGPLSFFEVYTCLAFVYFKEKKVDLAVLETGLGGRLDATNVVDPLAAVLTPISYDHMQQLGNTLGKIAAEKAGIIKRKGLAVICAPQTNEALAVIRRQSKRTGAKLYLIGKDIKYSGRRSAFGVKGALGSYPDLRIKLVGSHQIVNACTATATIGALKSQGIQVSMDALRKGLYHTLWPGRCETISGSPLVVLDGAQNASSAKVLLETLRGWFRYKKLILVFGISQDKDIAGVCRQLAPAADTVVLTRADNPRAAAAKDLIRYFNGKNIFLTGNLRDARRKAYQLAKKEDLILVTGSLFVVGEFRDAKN